MVTITLRRLLVTALVAAPLPLAAQAPSLHAAFPAPAPLGQAGMGTTPAAAPALDASRVGLSRGETAVRPDAAAEMARLRHRMPRRDARTLMIVGTAAFVAGLLIGDDVGTVMAVGGATAGLVGLYNYLQ